MGFEAPLVEGGVDLVQKLTRNTGIVSRLVPQAIIPRAEALSNITSTFKPSIGPVTKLAMA